MKCPNCKEARLVISERQGVEIDYCPDCRGVWLDRGELDKIIERSEYPRANVAVASGKPYSNYTNDHHKNGHHKPKRRKSLLNELFDF